MNVVDEIAGTLGDNIIEINDVVDFSDFLEYAKEEILEYVREETPHGEYGTDQESLIFKFRDKYYEVTVGNIEWNRYDKQYYFMEQYSPYKISHKEVVPKFSTKGIVEEAWERQGSQMDGEYKKFPLIDSPEVSYEEFEAVVERLKQKGFKIQIKVIIK